MSQTTPSKKSFWRPTTTKVIIGIIVLALVAFAGTKIFGAKQGTYQFVTVKQGPIDETVSVTGNTTPISSVSLGFGTGGTVASVNSDVGENVVAGQVLAELDNSDLDAQIRQAQATADSEDAKLQELQAGTRPEQLAVDQQTSDNAETQLVAAMNTAYQQTYDAIVNKSDTLFTNGNSENPTISIPTESWDQQRDIQGERLSLKDTLTAWQSDLAANDFDTTLAATDKSLAAAKSFLNDLSAIVTQLSVTSSASQTQINSYNASISAAAQEVSAAQSSVQSAESTWNSAQASLALAKAGSTPQDIASEQAQVESANAAVESAQAKMKDSEIVAPISGVVTQFDAKVGQFATAGTPLVSIISANQFEIDALVSETDIGKINIGDMATMTLDAFPNETFTGSVFYMDPAQTTSDGVVGYKIKVNFAKPDPRMKSGLTVNLVVETKHKDSVLYLPQYAILQNDSGTFAEVLQDNKVTDVPVTLGLQDQNGNVEIVSGVTDGEQVINVGLK